MDIYRFCQIFERMKPPEIQPSMGSKSKKEAAEDEEAGIMPQPMMLQSAGKKMKASLEAESDEECESEDD